MKTYQDIQGWFPNESAATLSRLMEEHNIRDVIEVGSFLGKSTAFFAAKCERLTAIDSFTLANWKEGRENGDAQAAGEDFFQAFIDNMKACGVYDKMRVCRMSSRDASDMIEDWADLIYLDAGHDYKSVVEDIILWRRKARKIICGDDYDENWPGVMKAVDEFLPQRVVEGRIWYAII